jgi:hypothetical protein
MDMNSNDAEILVSVCDIELVLQEISDFLKMMIADAKLEEKEPYLKKEFIDGWVEFKETQTRESLLKFIRNAPDYAPMILQYVAQCSPGGRSHTYKEIKQMFNSNTSNA